MQEILLKFFKAKRIFPQVHFSIAAVFFLFSFCLIFGFAVKAYSHSINNSPLEKIVHKKKDMAFPSQSQDISPSMLKEVLIAGDPYHIDKTLNDIKTMDDKKEILTFVQDLWGMSIKKHPEIPREIISKDMVRLNIADILIQSHYNGFIEVNISEFHEFVVSLLSSSEKESVFYAIVVISTFDKASDVKTIAKFAKNKEFFRPSVISLRSMCNSSAGKALNTLYDDFVDIDKRQFIYKAIQDREFKVKNICSRKYRRIPKDITQ